MEFLYKEETFEENKCCLLDNVPDCNYRRKAKEKITDDAIFWSYKCHYKDNCQFKSKTFEVILTTTIKVPKEMYDIIVEQDKHIREKENSDKTKE